MPQLKTLTGESALAFLLLHDHEHAQHLGFHIPLKSKQSSSAVATAAEDVVVDMPGSLTVFTTSQPGEPLAQDITVTIPGLYIAFMHRGPFSYPSLIPYPVEDCTNVPGTLYLRGQNPGIESNGFNAQQYPPYPGVPSPGRVTIDFWNDNRITGVFKTNVSNYISGGTGSWFPINDRQSV
ncbi:hypothetical protein PAXRUDRAFT_833341 [Paxillus rubicundulus Ve08.2h10]|uniref:Uncharacterized protein n=1 Tax=Paxillus rubicundulus Ve08.2h10 TaxID=930991 RepID=A0A0D0DA60_9AGAM|nr:hypothetical protein PAXRUDRAFT_833341 [Paxillus rubicundulus Ve08.2h10]